jgi:hypothetical protein
MNPESSGIRHKNGTWTDALGLLQSGIVDMWATSAFVTLERNSDFIYTTPFTMEKYGALMKRQTGFDVNINSVTAGIDVTIYGYLFAILTLLLFVCYINEKCQQAKDRNSIWQLFTSLLPSNGHQWKNQTGAARKVLMAMSGFGILILSALYQAKYSEQLMIPVAPPVVTLKDIESYVLSGNAKLMFPYDNAPVMQYVEHVSPVLNESMTVNQPIYNSYFVTMLHLINSRNAIMFDRESLVLHLLSTLEPDLCANYVYVSFDDWTRVLGALIMRKERVDVLEEMNLVVAERMSFVDDYIQSFQLKDECRQHIFPVNTPNPSYSSLQLVKIGGAFVFLFFFLSLSIVVLSVEVVLGKCVGNDEVEMEDIMETFEIHLRVDNTFGNRKRKKIFARYLYLLEAIQDDD